MGILGQNAVAPGINSIIYLLMTTIPEESALTLESSLDRPIETWAREFAEGAMMEIYQTTISTSFAGLTFGDLSLRWYQNTGSLIFALGLKDPKIVDKDVDVDGVKIIFNPYEYVLDGGEIAYAFVRTAKLADEIRTSEGVEIDGSVPDIIPISKVSSQSSNISIPEVDSTTILSSSAKFEEPMNGSMSDATEGSSAKKISIQVPTRKVENLETNSALSYAMFSGSGNVESVLGPGQFDASSELPATVKDHVVICDYDPDEYPPNLSFFIAPIRVKGSAPVVILSPVKPSHDEWKKLSAYGNVYHVRGKPLSRADLKKARVSKASQVVLLSNERSSSIDGADADASTILSILNIETLTSESKRKPPFLTFEVSRPESLKLIGDGDDYYNHQLHGQSLIPAFVAGHIFRPSIFQSVLVQAYYQPHLLHILRHFIFNLSSAAVKRSISQSEQRLEKRESQARRKFKFFGGSPREDRPHIDVDKPLPESNLPKPHGDVYKVAVPMSLKGSKYSSLVKYLLEKEGALAFALYRAYTNTNQEEAISKRLSGLQGLASEIRRRMTGEKDDDDDDDEEEKAVRYAVLNPRPDTRLKAFDYVFVFASKVPTFGART
ncbi:hypothetical protein HK098_002707 [Nowakowskiella sp. JEL0407]|nr:hypothetical protein HK098_002707 [Nowakowskiella sp. JEL0407]